MTGRIVTNELTFMSVEVKTEAAGLQTGVPKVLFKAASVETDDITPDGERFLMAVHPEGAQNTSITLVSNWTAGLKR